MLYLKFLRYWIYTSETGRALSCLVTIIVIVALALLVFWLAHWKLALGLCAVAAVGGLAFEVRKSLLRHWRIYRERGLG